MAEFLLAVEGTLDEAVVETALRSDDMQISDVYGREGKTRILSRLGGYNNAGRFRPVLVVIDLDQDHDCAPPLIQEHLPERSKYTCFRVAVREVEAWLLGDPDALAEYLHVARSKVPARPQELPDPKLTLVNLARRSRKRAIREEMVPRQGSGRTIGPGYTACMVQFAKTMWRPDVAREQCESLSRLLACVKQVADDWDTNQRDQADTLWDTAGE